MNLYVGSVFRTWNDVLKWRTCMLVVDVGFVDFCIIIICVFCTLFCVSSVSVFFCSFHDLSSFVSFSFPFLEFINGVCGFR